MWYDINKTLSHNCLLNFVVGPRGVGKTYSAKKRVIDNWLKKKEQFIYLRRYDTELKKAQIELFFKDIQNEYPDDEFLVENGKFYINNKIAGYYLPLSKAAQVKSVPYPDVSMIIFDEFIIDQGMVRYLPNEVTTFNEMYSTIARLRDVKAFFLSNAITFTNPYFVFFDLKLQQDQKVCKKNDILLELVDSPEYEEKAASTRFGKIIADTEYGKYAIHNEFLRDNDTFIEKMNEPGVSIFTLRVDNIDFGVYRIIKSNLWYISEKVDKTINRVITVDMTSHNTDSIYARENGGMMWFSELRQKFYRAEVRFTSVKAKNLIMPILRRM